MQQQKLFSKIFNKSDNEEDTKSFLDSVLNEHSYFGLAQFYALKSTAFSSLKYNEVAAKTNLFFNNSFFLNAQLLVKDATIESISPKPVEIMFESNKDDITLNEMRTIEKEENATTEIEPIREDIIAEQTQNTSLKETYSSIEIKKDNEFIVDEPQILFEPLHASDYFASQGIKLSEDAMANDKLGKQLKSFTAWLKTMKKVHPDKLPAVTAITETAVQTQAEKSNIEEEIVTEPMAEAYIQQNKYTKAVEIYSKLSLINPAKSAYFVAKIDSLKK